MTSLSTCQRALFLINSSMMKLFGSCLISFMRSFSPNPGVHGQPFGQAADVPEGYTVHHLWFESYMIKNISPIHPPSCWWNTLVSRHRQRPNASLSSSNGFVQSRFSGVNQFFILNLTSSSPRQKRVRRRRRGKRTSLMESTAVEVR